VRGSIKAGYGRVACHVAVLVGIGDRDHFKHRGWYMNKFSVLSELLAFFSIQVHDLKQITRVNRESSLSRK
jgi:hypothetical protein